MANCRSKTPAEHAERVKRLRDRIRAALPQSFKAAVVFVHHECLAEIEALFPDKGEGRNSAGLYHGERLDFGSDRATIRNVAASTDGYRYGAIAHKGRGELNAPTKLRGKRFYVWMRNRDDARPQSDDEWARAKEAGAVAMAKHLRARKAKPWRKRVLTRVKGKITKVIDGFHVTGFGIAAK